jgi:putative hydrolase of the HAD superfamily
MPQITTLFFDIGGVILSNGWETRDRQEAAKRFSLDLDDFEARHDQIVHAFELGLIDLHEYLNQTVFTQPRPFHQHEFVQFMFAQSEAYTDTLSLVSELARLNKYLMATLNNESLEINIHRIEKFHLTQYFSAFYSSCFLGAKKPEGEIYRKALQITQRSPEECIFIDDRKENLEQARHLGMNVIHHQNAQQLRQELSRLGVETAASGSAIS